MNELPSSSAGVIQLGEAIIRSLDEMAAIGELALLSASQIQRMRSMVQNRIESVKSGQLPPKSMRHRYLTRETIDTWPLGIDIAKNICEFEERYNNF